MAGWMQGNCDGRSSLSCLSVSLTLLSYISRFLPTPLSLFRLFALLSIQRPHSFPLKNLLYVVENLTTVSSSLLHHWSLSMEDESLSHWSYIQSHQSVPIGPSWVTFLALWPITVIGEEDWCGLGYTHILWARHRPGILAASLGSHD